MSAKHPVGRPLANYLAAKRVGDMFYMSGVIAVDPDTRRVIDSGYGKKCPRQKIRDSRGRWSSTSSSCSGFGAARVCAPVLPFGEHAAQSGSCVTVVA